MEASKPKLLNPIPALTEAFSNPYFKGRSGRYEFWWFALFIILAGRANMLCLALLKGLGNNWVLLIATCFCSMLYTVCCYYYWVVMCRRLHDVGRSGWWVLSFAILTETLVLLDIFPVNSLFTKSIIIPSLSILQCVTHLIILCFCLFKGKYEHNIYGVSHEFESNQTEIKTSNIKTHNIILRLIGTFFITGFIGISIIAIPVLSLYGLYKGIADSGLNIMLRNLFPSDISGFLGWCLHISLTIIGSFIALVFMSWILKFIYVIVAIILSLLEVLLQKVTYPSKFFSIVCACTIYNFFLYYLEFGFYSDFMEQFRHGILFYVVVAFASIIILSAYCRIFILCWDNTNLLTE